MPDRMQVLAQYLADTEEATLAYLFGSRAEGTAGPQSGYDIALLVRDPSPDQQARLAHDIGGILGTDWVDMVFLNRAPVELAYAVIAQGRLLYERPVADRVEFEAKLMSLYAEICGLYSEVDEHTP